MQLVAASTTPPEVVTMRRLSQNTSGVINGLVEAGQTALLTKRGRFIAMIVPIAPGAVEAAALDHVLSSADMSRLRPAVDEGDDEVYTYTPEEAAAALGVGPQP